MPLSILLIIIIGTALGWLLIKITIVSRQNHQIGSLLQINYQNGSVSILFTKGVCYFTTKRLPEERVPPERDTWLDWTRRCDRGGRACLSGATCRAYLPGATSRADLPSATSSGGVPGTSLFPIKPFALRFIFTQKS